MARARLAGEAPPELPPVSSEAQARAAEAAQAAPPASAPPAGQPGAPSGGQAAQAQPGNAAQPDVILPADVKPSQRLCLIECGDFSWFDQPFPELRARTHLQVMQALGCLAAVPGSAELKFTLDQALTFMKDSPVPFASCNLTSKDKNVTFAPSVLLAPGWYMVGVTAWAPAAGAFPKERWWDLDDPLEGAKRAIAALPRGSRVVISALHQPADMLTKLAALPGVAAVIGAEGKAQVGIAGLLPAPPRRGAALMLASLGAGQAGGRDVLPWQVELAESWPDWPQVMQVLHDEQEQLRLKILENRGVDVRVRNWRKVEWGQSGKYLPGESETAQAENSYAGPDRCRECHPQAFSIWKASRHSHALISLARSGDQQNIDCLKCHVTALLQPGGYNPYDDRPELGWVGCENCHGPGATHVDKMTKQKKLNSGKVPAASTPKDTGIERGRLEDCLSCHDDYNSPGFDTAKGWAKVKHS